MTGSKKLCIMFQVILITGFLLARIFTAVVIYHCGLMDEERTFLSPRRGFNRNSGIFLRPPVCLSVTKTFDTLKTLLGILRRS